MRAGTATSRSRRRSWPRSGARGSSRTRGLGWRASSSAASRSDGSSPAAATTQLDRAGVFLELLNYGSPVLEPELYELDLWFDESHLTREGARRFSERLALGIARLAERRE